MKVIATKNSHAKCSLAHNGLLLFLFACVLLVNCQHKPKNKELCIDPSQASHKEIMLSDISENVSYIVLSTELLLGHIMNIEFNDSLIFVASVRNPLYVFDTDGRFLNAIGNIGQGVGEYGHSNSFTIDSENNLVYLLDRGKVLVYDFDGTYLRDFPVHQFNAYFTDIKFNEASLYLFEYISFGQAKYNWLVLDRYGDSVGSHLNHLPQFSSDEGGEGGVFSHGDTLFYWNDYNDTIFAIHEHNATQAARFANDKFRNTTKAVETPETDFRILSMTKSAKGIWLTYFLTEAFHTSLYCMLNQQLYLLNSIDMIEHGASGPGVTNDLDAGVNFVPHNHVFIGGNEFLMSWAYPYELITKVNSETFKTSTPKYPEKKRELEQLANSLSNDDNPVLMLVKLKE